MSERASIEKLAERGTWVDDFNETRLRQSDGVIVDYVEIDPRLRPKQKRVWLFFWKNGEHTKQAFDEQCTQDWRRRLANG